MIKKLLNNTKIVYLPKKCPFCTSPRISKPFRMREDNQIYRCRDCRLEFKQATSEDRLQAIYNEEYECLDRNKDEAIYMESRQSLAEEYVENIVNELGLDLSKIRVLDYGAGPGNISEVLKRGGAEVIAIENNEHALRCLSTRGIPAQPNLNGLNSESFDLVLCVEVLEHLSSPWLVLKDLWKLLKPDGAIYLSTPNNRGASAMIYRGRWREYLKPTHFFFFNSSSITRLLRTIGFSNIQRCRWRLDFYEPSHTPSIRDRLQGFLQVVQLDGGLRYIASKMREE